MQEGVAAVALQARDAGPEALPEGHVHAELQRDEGLLGFSQRVRVSAQALAPQVGVHPWMQSSRVSVLAARARKVVRDGGADDGAVRFKPAKGQRPARGSDRDEHVRLGRLQFARGELERRAILLERAHHHVGARLQPNRGVL